MAKTSGAAAVIAVLSAVVLVLGVGAAEAQLRHYCGLDFARAVFRQCAMAKRGNPVAPDNQLSDSSYQDLIHGNPNDLFCGVYFLLGGFSITIFVFYRLV